MTEENLSDAIDLSRQCVTSIGFLLAYLLRYKQMSLREAFHYLRARRHIVGPNFGFIKQVRGNELAAMESSSVSIYSSFS